MFFGGLLFVIITIAPSYQQADYNASIHTIVDKFAAGLGVTADYVFSNGPTLPINQEVTIYCILPKSTTFQTTYPNDPNVASKINLANPVGILIHGWLDSFQGGFLNTTNVEGWMESTSTYWANNASLTVCSVDWSRLANYEYMIAATQNTKLVASYVAELLQFLNSLSVAYINITVAGHSLGGQISGLIGAILKGTLGRIVALDPAGPAFTFPIDYGIANRLDVTDARYVQVIHTAAGTLGTAYTSGSSDYWLNGGAIQSGCILPGLIGPPADSPEVLDCSHLRAVEIFRSSLSKLNNFSGTICNTYADYKASPVTKTLGTCKNQVDKLGIWTKQLNGTFYLDTSNTSPFALG